MLSIMVFTKKVFHVIGFMDFELLIGKAGLRSFKDLVGKKRLFWKLHFKTNATYRIKLNPVIIL
jgi:hypothetical protein